MLPFAVREPIYRQLIPEARVGSNRESDPAYLPIRLHTGPLDKRPSMRDSRQTRDGTSYGPAKDCQAEAPVQPSARVCDALSDKSQKRPHPDAAGVRCPTVKNRA